MSRQALLAAAIGASLIAATGARGAGSSGTAVMVQRLKALAAAADPLRNPILNRERVTLLRQRFQQAETLDVGFALAEELLKAGDTAEALELALRIREAIESTNVPDKRALLDRTGQLLGLAYLRAGEQGNCLLHHNAASCVFPLARGRRAPGEGARADGGANLRGTADEFEPPVVRLAAESFLHERRRVSRSCARALADSR
jgi:hypothetical protein